MMGNRHIYVVESIVVLMQTDDVSAAPGFGKQSVPVINNRP
jgi:hypothetical protein